MKRYERPSDPLNEPYTASSLLQKAIRRGESDLALLAVEKLLPRRGKGVSRRLLGIAFEDVGIANIGLLARVLEMAESHLSDSTMPPSKGLEEAIVALAESPKSRSADHLICSARQAYLSRSAKDRADLSDIPAVLAVAGDPSQPLIDRMAVVEDLCGRQGRGARAIQAERLEALMSVLPYTAHDAIDISLRGFKVLRDGIALPLPLLVSAISEADGSAAIAEHEMPDTVFVHDVPTWVWDKHTSVGKRAFRRFIRENEPLSRCLNHHACVENHLAVACMAGFYFDAAPVKRRMDWAGSVELELAGKSADMRKVGCPPCGIEPIMEAVANNIDHLNAIRVELAGGNPS